MAKWRETPTTPSRDLASALADLAAKQEPLGPEFEAALGDRSALYDYSDALQEISTIGQEMERQRAREEAIVKAAWERAAKMGDECQRQNGPLFKKGFDEPYRRGLEAGGQAVASAIRALADDPAEMAAIIKAAGKDRG
jgi:hypothetical protein